MMAMVTRPERDFSSEQPVSDETFKLFLSQYRYDRNALNPEIESEIDEGDWLRQRISLDAAYGGERLIVYLFLPKNSRPPYQTIVYFPGSNAIHNNDSETALSRGVIFDFMLKDGRAVIFPIYKGTYERGDELNSDYPATTNFYKDHVIMWAKDMGRAIDYLETREDLDVKKLAYFGTSWGGAMGAIMPAVENRLKLSILYVAGLLEQSALPEADQINFITRVKVPVLMVNGKYDFFFPIETAQKPMFDLFGAPEADKKWVIYEGGHSVPRVKLIEESLMWLDKYFGAVNPSR
jgi:cephalosporin-C deacetylase-like acetyl esterase